MRNLIKGVLFSVVAMALVVVPLSRAQAQQETPAEGAKPVVVASIASVDRLLDEVSYLMKSAGVEPLVGMVKTRTEALTNGLDRSKPIGLLVTTDGIAFKPLGFVPVTDLKQWLASLSELVGEPKDAGDGVFELASGPIPLFVKEQGGWAFIAQDAASLVDLPKDPVKLLNGLEKQYSLGVRAFVQNVPELYRGIALTAIKSGYQRAMQQSDDGEDTPEKKLREKLGENQLNQLASVINEADQVTFGWAVNKEEQKTYLDFSLTALADTKTARQMSVLQDVKSSHAGFLLPDATVSIGLTTKLIEEDIVQATAMLDTIRDVALKEISKDDDLPNEETRRAAKEVLTDLFSVLTETFKSGKVDGGAALVLRGKALNAVIGGYCADSATLEKAFRKIAALAEEEPDFPGVKFDAVKHGEIRFHTLSLPVPDDGDAREILGDTLEVALGIGPSSAYLALGVDAVGLAKRVIDGSQTESGKAVLPFQMKLALGPILKFAASVKDDPAVTLMANALQSAQGKDHVAIKVMAIDRGVTYRIEIEQGVLKLIGLAGQISSLAPGSKPLPISSLRDRGGRASVSK